MSKWLKIENERLKSAISNEYSSSHSILVQFIDGEKKKNFFMIQNVLYIHNITTFDATTILLLFIDFEKKKITLKNPLIEM